MTELVPFTHEPPTFDAEWLLDPAEIAQRIGGTDFVPVGLRDNPAAITAALLYGAEVGLGRMASLATIAVINGRPTLAAEAQRALILAAGHEVWVDESTATKCVVAGRRRGSSQVTRITWTIDDAKRAGLAGRNPWRTYPRQMLLARASAELARAVFPDVIHGLRASEELDGDAPLDDDHGAPEPKATPTRRRRRKRDDDEPPAGETPRGDDQPQPPGGPGAGPTPGASPPLAAVPDTSDVEEIDAPASPAAAENDDELMASREQLNHVFALMGEVGLDKGDRELRLAYTSRTIGRPIETSANLTSAEASALINDLQRIAALPAGLERDKELLPPEEAQLLDDAQMELGAQLVEE